MAVFHRIQTYYFLTVKKSEHYYLEDNLTLLSLPSLYIINLI